MPIEIRAMTSGDYESSVALWARTEGVRLGLGDTAGGLAAYLQRNAGSSFVALDGERLVGTLLAGHDGYRGYLEHLAVEPDYREQGIGSRLVQLAIEALGQQGIPRAHLFVVKE